MERTFPVRLLGDERYYVNTALNIAQGRGHVFKKASRLWRPPAHSYLLSHFVDPWVAVALDERGDPLDPKRGWDTVHALLRVEVALSAALVAVSPATISRSRGDNIDRIIFASKGKNLFLQDARC